MGVGIGKDTGLDLPRFVILGIACVAAWLPTGCASIPKNPPKTASFTAEPATNGVLSDLSRQVQGDLPDGQSAFLLLEENAEALAWRLALIDHAVTSVDMQYFAWGNDEAGRLMLERCIEAARRGVRVRILVDDLLTGTSRAGAAAYDLVPNFDLRLFNPGRVRTGGISSLTEFILNFRELNRRMHNKLMVVDGRWAIMGGRNIGNAYFGLSKKYNFVDLDLLMTGPILADLRRAFDEYWNSPSAYPAEAMGAGIRQPAVEAKIRLLEELLEKDRPFLESCALPVDRRDWRNGILKQVDEMVPGRAGYVQDVPVVDEGRTRTRVLADTMRAHSPRPTTESITITPYLIPTSEMLKNWRVQSSQDIGMTTLVPSMGANNHTAAHSHYKKYRRKILRSGVRLYEFNGHPGSDMLRLSNTHPVASKFNALHVKAGIVDRRYVYLGSVNLDPRALEINTENIIVVDSPQLAGEVNRLFETMRLPGNAWEVTMDPYDRLYWKSGDESRTLQPARSFLQRCSSFLWSLLPIGGQL